MKIETPTGADKDTLALASRTGWPDELRVLVERFPREQWQGHANLGDMAQFWLARHNMFRELSAATAGIAAKFREGDIAAQEFPQLFVPRLQFMLQQLDAHHHVEDLHYFPVFRAAEARLARGFDVLDADHHAIHANMAATADAANTMLRALPGDKDTLARAADGYAGASGALIKGLLRHLDDEEDLIVPVILDRGEAALGVGH